MPMDAQSGVDILMLRETKSLGERTVFEIDGWIIWHWNDDTPASTWGFYYLILHRHSSGLAKASLKRESEYVDPSEQYHGVCKQDDGSVICIRCESECPNEVVALYELLTWDQKGYGE
jgi:hypothetical protein